MTVGIQINAWLLSSKIQFINYRLPARAFKVIQLPGLLREQNNSMTERFEQGAEEGEGTGQWKK
jgi:hypothetical protein